MPNNKQESFLLDTSALISLQTINLLEVVLHNVKVISIHSVLDELKQSAVYDDQLGKIAQAVLKYQSQFIIKDTELKERIIFLEETDNKLYDLALQENLPLITDDYRLNHHTRKKITVYFSTFFLMYFTLIKILSKEQALQKLEVLRELRNWNNNIMYLRTKKGLEQLKD